MKKEFEIMGSDDRLFCKMERTGQGIILKTDKSSITLTDLADQMANPEKLRGKKPKVKKDGRIAG